MVFAFLCLPYFTEHNSLWVHEHCHKWQDFIPLWLSHILLYTRTTFLCLHIYRWTSTCPQHLQPCHLPLYFGWDGGEAGLFDVSCTAGGAGCSLVSHSPPWETSWAKGLALACTVLPRRRGGGGKGHCSASTLEYILLGCALRECQDLSAGLRAPAEVLLAMGGCQNWCFCAGLRTEKSSSATCLTPKVFKSGMGVPSGLG